jgi:ABC-2 type transport system ATP-binding protein
VPQELNINYWDSVYNVVTTQAGFYGLTPGQARARAEVCLGQLQLWDRRRETARNLSGGMKRRLMIARALMHQPRLLILDEPTAGVDIEIRRSMWQFLREINAAGTTIILTTHYLEEAENLCRHVAIIDQGRIIEDDRMVNVLRKLNREVFVLNLREPLTAAPPLNGYAVQRVSDNELEVEISREQDLNGVFAALSAEGVHVISMRNKANRLEELFLDLTERRDGAGRP